MYRVLRNTKEEGNSHVSPYFFGSGNFQLRSGKMKTTRKTLLVYVMLGVLVLCTSVLASPVRRLRPPRNPHSRYGPEYGCVKWQFQTGGPVTASVALSHNKRRVYIPCEDGKLYALDAKTGSFLWSYDANSPLLGSPAVRPGGRVYVGTSDGELHAIGRRGRLLWTYPTEGAIFASPGLAAERLHVCSLDGSVYSLACDGNELWSFETDGFATIDGAVFATPQTGPDGTLYVAGVYDPNLYALDPNDGSIIWARSFEAALDPCDPNSPMTVGWPFAAPVVAPDGTVYQTLLYNANLYAVEPEAGETIWSTDLAGTVVRLRLPEPPNYEFTFTWFGVGEPPDYIDGCRVVDVLGKNHRGGSMSKPALARDGTIYVAFDDSYLRAVNPDGTVKWATRLGSLDVGALVGGFTLTVDDAGLIYAASDDNYLYVVDPDGNEIAQFQGDDWLSHPVIARNGTLLVSDANNTVWAISERACDGEEPVLDGPGLPEPSEPTKVKGRWKHKSRAGIRVRR
jgi:outer membrane protein assembly factor BamB